MSTQWRHSSVVAHPDDDRDAALIALRVCSGTRPCDSLLGLGAVISKYALKQVPPLTLLVVQLAVSVALLC